jgi:hypothetical protein
MIIKASGRAALIVAAGLFVLLASPARSATDGDDSATNAQSDDAATPPVAHRTHRHAWHHKRHYAHRRSHAVAKADDDKDTDDKTLIADAAADSNKALPDIPPAVANANAQMLLAGAQLSAAAAIPDGTEAAAAAPDNAGASNETKMAAASDQLNDTDRTLQEASSTTAAPASSAPAPATMTGESTVWDNTSLIGKIFIGFGALLTAASAARMFIT